ncbi:hypothetical protein ACA910_009463 [Epithemia clementina (nom. ined.)]
MKDNKACTSASKWLDSTLFLKLSVALTLLGQVSAQHGSGICSCSPSFMTFKILFNLTCPGNIDKATRPGIADTACEAGNIDGGNDQNTDYVPVTITKVEILELDADQGVLKGVTNTGDFVNGQEFNYTSVAVDNPELDIAVNGLQMTLDGRNLNGDQILNTWVIVFTNECGIFPLLEAGDEIGWTEFVSSTLPQAQYCPGVPTDAPSAFPSVSALPSTEPSLSPSDYPSSLPSWSPSVNPSSIPTFSPSANPTLSPSVNPTDDPTLSPSVNPTDDPTLSPSVYPTLSPFVYPTSFPSWSPSVQPTAFPSPLNTNTDFPTESPSMEPTALPSDSCPPISRKPTKMPSHFQKKTKTPYGGKKSKNQSPDEGKKSKSHSVDGGKKSKTYSPTDEYYSTKGGKGAKNSKSLGGKKQVDIYTKKYKEGEEKKKYKIIKAKQHRQLVREHPGTEYDDSSKGVYSQYGGKKSGGHEPTPYKPTPKPTTPLPVLCPEVIKDKKNHPPRPQMDKQTSVPSKGKKSPLSKGTLYPTTGKGKGEFSPSKGKGEERSTGKGKRGDIASSGKGKGQGKGKGIDAPSPSKGKGSEDSSDVEKGKGKGSEDSADVGKGKGKGSEDSSDVGKGKGKGSEDSTDMGKGKGMSKAPFPGKGKGNADYSKGKGSMEAPVPSKGKGNPYPSSKGKGSSL